MNSHFSPLAANQNHRADEWEILCAASHVSSADDSSPRLHHALEHQGSGIHWPALSALADRHGVSSLLCRSLSSFPNLVPHAALESLQKRYDSNSRNSLFLARELIRVIDCAESLGIEVISYKGVTLADSYYGDIALRQTGDIDLIVRERDVLRMKAGLIDLGFTPHAFIPAALEQNYVETGCEWAFGNSAGRNLLELQWQLQPRYYAVDYHVEELFSRSANAKVAGHIVKTPAPEDLLLVLSLHAAKHVWGRLIWLCDIVQILHRKDLNWEWLQERIRKLGIARILHITLLLASRLLHAKLPAAVEARVQADRAAQFLADRIARSMMASVSYEEPRLSYFRLMMSLRERPSDRLRFFSRLAFTPGPGEWNALRLPNSLMPLYRVVRMGRLAARFARG